MLLESNIVTDASFGGGVAVMFFERTAKTIKPSHCRQIANVASRRHIGDFNRHDTTDNRSDCSSDSLYIDT